MRIVAGKYKGVVLNTFDYDNIRPTTDKVREAVFSKIQFNIVDSSWLDLFGGTGAVGLEALSRRAKEVVVVDDNQDSISLITKNYQKCRIQPNLIKKGYIKALTQLKNENKKFDYIYLDPPFNTNYGLDAVKFIDKFDLLANDGVIIYEHLRETIINNELYNFEIMDTKNYGTIAVTYLVRKKGGEQDV